MLTALKLFSSVVLSLQIAMDRMKVLEASVASSYRWCIDIPQGWTHSVDYTVCRFKEGNEKSKIKNPKGRPGTSYDDCWVNCCCHTVASQGEVIEMLSNRLEALNET